MKFSFKRWKMGLLISILSGLFNGVIGIAVGMTWKQVCIFIAIAIAKDGLLYLKQHPIESIEDTTIVSKTVTASGTEKTTETKTTDIHKET